MPVLCRLVFYVRENIRKCERIPILRADDIRPYTDNRTGTVLTTQYHAKLRIGDENLCTKQPIAVFG